MVSLIDSLRARARVLHRRASRLDPASLARLGLEGASADEVAATLQRRHCLAAIARELGFSGWPHALAVLEGRDTGDYGTLLYPRGGAAHTNIWCKSYEEARGIREKTGGFLLAYKTQYFIVDRYFIETLGLDPDDPDWEAIGRDWARPRQPEARARLYARLIEQQTDD